MKAFPFARLAALLAATITAGAQEKIVSTRVVANAPDAALSVDGAYVRGGATFLWPQGSKHTLSASPVQDHVRANTRYVFEKWIESATNQAIPGGHTVSVTADPAIGSFEAVFDVQYALRLLFGSCGEDAACVSPAGTIYINNVPYTSSTWQWFSAGATVSVQAIPKPGFIFAGWNNTANLGWTAFSASITMNEPVLLSPKFVPARKIRILSCGRCDGVSAEPEGLRVLADRASLPTPASLDWGWDTTHTLGVVSPQWDNAGGLWIFSSWSDGGPAVHAYTVKPGAGEETIIAKFVPGTRVSLLTEPPGLKMEVDGRENWQSYNFTWAAGDKHRISAPLEQRDSRGRLYRFQGWSHGAAASHELAVGEAGVEGLRLTARYELLGRLTISTSPSNLELRVNGETCRTPCALDRAAGTQVKIAAPAQVELYDGAALFLDGWPDGAAGERSYTFSTADQSMHADYRLKHRLTLLAEPADAAAFLVEPRSAGGYFDAETDVSVTVNPAAGYRFQRWVGDAGGMHRSVWLRMSGPRWAQALLEPAPYVGPAGARNAAAETPGAGVAPGSIVSLFGVNLAARAEAGPATPLAQTLGGVVVRIGPRVLPLVFVSPEQINFQLPYEMEEGRQTLTVQSENQPPVTVEIEVVRNAPGLFHEIVEGQPGALAFHADGMAVNAANPARPGESITLLGTGFGPYDRQPVTGFAIPDGLPYHLQDKVELLSGETLVEPGFTGAATRMVGIDAIRLRIPAGASGPLEMKARVNGRETNTVFVPVE
jgi:uncharacterized protein (TIGR03437 family)